MDPVTVAVLPEQREARRIGYRIWLNHTSLGLHTEYLLISSQRLTNKKRFLSDMEVIETAVTPGGPRIFFK